MVSSLFEVSFVRCFIRVSAVITFFFLLKIERTVSNWKFIFHY